MSLILWILVINVYLGVTRLEKWQRGGGKRWLDRGLDRVFASVDRFIDGEEMANKPHCRCATCDCDQKTWNAGGLCKLCLNLQHVPAQDARLSERTQYDCRGHRKGEGRGKGTRG